jgi:hypothetical protein
MLRHILTIDRPSTGGDDLGRNVGEGHRVGTPGDDQQPVENPAVRAFHAMAVARTVGVAARVGVFGELADGPSSVLELASRLRLQPEPLQLMLDLLVGEGLLDYCRPHYAVSVGARRWLDPESATSVNTFLSRTLDYWEWWADLEPIVTGQFPTPGAAPAADDERAWLRTTRGDYEIARLVADELASAITAAVTAGSPRPCASSTRTCARPSSITRAPSRSGRKSCGRPRWTGSSPIRRATCTRPTSAARTTWCCACP